MRNGEMLSPTTVEELSLLRKIHKAKAELSASEARVNSFAKALRSLQSRLTGDAGAPVGFYAVKRVDADDVEGEQYVVKFPEGRGLPRAIFSLGQRDLTRENFTRCLRQVLAFRNAAMTTWAREFCPDASKTEIDGWLKDIDDVEGSRACTGRLARLWAGMSADAVPPQGMPTLNDPPQPCRANQKERYEEKSEISTSSTPSGQDLTLAKQSDETSPAVRSAHVEIAELRKQLEIATNENKKRSQIEAELLTNKVELAHVSSELLELKSACAKFEEASHESPKLPAKFSSAGAALVQQQAAANPTAVAQPQDVDNQATLHSTQDLLLALRSEIANAQDTDDEIQDTTNAVKNTHDKDVPTATSVEAHGLEENTKVTTDSPRHANVFREAIDDAQDQPALNTNLTENAFRERKTSEDDVTNNRSGWDLSDMKAAHLMKHLSRVRTELQQVDAFHSDLDNVAAGTLTNLLGIREALQRIDEMESISTDETDRVAQLQAEIESYKLKIAALSESQKENQNLIRASQEETHERIVKLGRLKLQMHKMLKSWNLRRNWMRFAMKSLICKRLLGHRRRHGRPS